MHYPSRPRQRVIIVDVRKKRLRYPDSNWEGRPSQYQEDVGVQAAGLYCIAWSKSKASISSADDRQVSRSGIYTLQRLDFR